LNLYASRLSKKTVAILSMTMKPRKRGLLGLLLSKYLTDFTGVSYLRERKASIAKLFDAVGLQPRAGARAKTKRFDRKYEDAIDSLAERKNGKTKKELVGDGEEIEVDASEELSRNDLNLIYQK